MRIRTFPCGPVAVGAVALLALTAPAPLAHAQSDEFGDNTPYYEDDGILDITEWFDGNDYNPTDEAWWRWDDETYQSWKDTSGDADSDNSWSYGYKDRDDNDWFYDYYDPTTYSFDHNANKNAGKNNVYTNGYRYDDYDNDGIVDAYTGYSDSDGDGIYDHFDYYSFTDNGTAKQKQQAKSEKMRESRQQAVTGQIEKTKQVQVRGGKMHTIVAIKAQDQSGQSSSMSGDALIADLGTTDNLKSLNLKAGDTITVNGPKAQVGKQAVILAKSFDVNGKTTQIDRNARSITGKVLDTHTITIRGQKHQMAMIETTQKGKTHKCAVDLGPVDQLGMTLAKGSNITFSGFPVKVKDNILIMAQSIQSNGQTKQINRQPNKTGSDNAQPRDKMPASDNR